MAAGPRALVTGLGVLCPVATSQEQLWSALCSGRTGFAGITCFDPGPAGRSVVGMVPPDRLGSPCADDRVLELVVAAGRQALDAAGALHLEQTALVVGSTDSAGGLIDGALNGRLDRARREELAGLLDLAGAAARRLGLGGPALSIGNASAAIAIAVGHDLVTSSKPVLGHCQGAAGALEAAAAVLSICHQTVPPIFGVAEVDPGWRDPDLVRDAPRPWPLRTVLSVSSGLGDTNAALLLAGDAGDG